MIRRDTSRMRVYLCTRRVHMYILRKTSWYVGIRHVCGYTCAHVTYMCASDEYTDEWVMKIRCIWVSQKEGYTWISQIQTWKYAWCVCVTAFIHVWHDSFTRYTTHSYTWLIHTRGMITALSKKVSKKGPIPLNSWAHPLLQSRWIRSTFNSFNEKREWTWVWMEKKTSVPPKNGLITPSTNGAIPYFLVLPGSELSITEITVYTYFSPLETSREFTHKSEWNTVPVNLIIEPIWFSWNIIFTFYYTRVRPQCDYSILGRKMSVNGSFWSSSPFTLIFEEKEREWRR